MSWIFSKRSISVQKRGKRGVRLSGSGFHLDDDGLCEVGVPLGLVGLVVRMRVCVRRQALVIVGGRRVARRLLVQRARRVLVLVLVPELQLILVRLQLRRVRLRRHHGVVAHAQRRRAALAVLVVPRREHLPVVPVQHRRVRIRRLRVEPGVAPAARRQQVVRRQLVRVLI